MVKQQPVRGYFWIQLASIATTDSNDTANTIDLTGAAVGKATITVTGYGIEDGDRLITRTFEVMVVTTITDPVLAIDTASLSSIALPYYTNDAVGDVRCTAWNTPPG